MEDGDSYQIDGIMVREYKNKRFLSIAREGSNMTEINDIGPVLEVGSDEDDLDNLRASKTHYWEMIRVSGVIQLDSYGGCLKCTAKVLPLPDDIEYGQCVKSQMMQCMADVTKELSAQLLLKLPTGQLALRAFGSTLVQIAQSSTGEVTPICLLKAPPFNMTYRDGIILTVTRTV